MLVGEEEKEAVLKVLDRQRLFRFYGPGDNPSVVDEFEERFAKFLGVEHALAVSSGTAALICGVAAMGVGPGDEVIVPAYTWEATASAVYHMGGVPVVAEVDDTFTLDPEDVEAKITPYTRAIIPVHMSGVPCKMDAIMDIARRHNLKVLEDTAQANGGSYHGKHLGTWGDIGMFSLQFNKIITCGEGGAVVTNDTELYHEAMIMHDMIAPLRVGVSHDRLKPSINFRMTELQGAIINAQLDKLPDLLSRMRESKAVLRQGIDEIGRERPVTMRRLNDPAGDTGYTLVISLETPEKAAKVREALAAENIGTTHMYQPDVPDFHVAAHWAPIINKRGWSEKANPWTWAHREITYEMPKTLEILSRSLMMQVSPLLSSQDIEEIMDGYDKVLRALA
jgi:dTDP-4-amino-4,6-dideoxygalactose transaminase